MGTKTGACCTTLLLALLMLSVNAIISKTSIKLEDGGYTDIVVAIDESLDENEELIEGIKEMFRDGSPYLYQATKNRVYFKNITILVPSHWSAKQYGSPGSLTFDFADVIVAPPNPLWAPDPYTKQVQECGKPGSFIQFVEEIFTDSEAEDMYGNLGRVLVHEWGHLRWGLFNEYPDPVADHTHMIEFYLSSEDGKWKPVACSLEYDIIPSRPPRSSDSENDVLLVPRCNGNETGGYEKECYARVVDADRASGSIMFGKTIFPQIINFCDNISSDPGNLHNREAPNKHNRLCNQRSAWEVMREHDDFKDDNSPPSDLSESDIMPSFTLVQSRGLDDCRIVLVIDTSGSMGSYNRIAKAISASTAFIGLVNEGTWVGIVTFTDYGSIQHDLVQVLSPSERLSLRNTLSLRAAGGTCIGCGLERGRQVLLQHPSRDLAGGDILLMSDGADDRFANHQIRQTLIGDGVRVNTVAIGEDAYGELNLLASNTNGSSFYYGDDDGSANLLTSLFQTACKCDPGRVQIAAIGFSLGNGEMKDGYFHIDPSIGNGTQVIVTYTQNLGSSAGVTLNLTPPNGDPPVTSESSAYDVDIERRVIMVFISNMEEVGEWSYSITNTYSGTQSVTFSVYSRPSTEVVQGEGTIVVNAEISDSTLDLAENIVALIVYAEVRKGFRPVINATVIASIERPEGNPITLPLLDNGAGADITVNDGIYSRSFLEYDGNGYYGISVTVENDGNASILGLSSPGSRSPPFINITEDGRVVSGGSIGNYSVRLPGDSIFDTLQVEVAPPFTRSSSAGSTNVPILPPGFTPGQDLFPPNRVQDLRVKSTSVDNSTAVLTWSAPGDDLDIGQATSYDIRTSNSSGDLQSYFSNAIQLQPNEILDGDTSNPKPFGFVEEYVIKVPDVPFVPAFSYVFALQATDDAGKTSPVSNVVVATFRRFIPTAPCDGMVCRNGGTLNESLCICSCPDDFQGALCQHIKSQLRNGVEITLFMDDAQCLVSVAPLRISVAEKLNFYCDDNFDTCCPESERNSSSGSNRFVSANDVLIADGYPKVEAYNDDQRYECSLVVYVLRPADPELCRGGVRLPERQKRDDTSHIQKRSAEPVYVSREILFAAIKGGKDAIESNLQNATSQNTSLVQIARPKVDGEETVIPTTMTSMATTNTTTITTTTTTTTTTAKPYKIPRDTIVIAVACVLLFICALVLILGIYRYKSRKRGSASFEMNEKGDSEMVYASGYVG